MAMGSFNSSGAQAPMAEINTTPLVDVMLVLLIIFIITAPLMTHSVQVDLPRASSVPTSENPLTLSVSIKPDGSVFLDNGKVDGATLSGRLRDAVARDPKTELHLMADRAVRYESVVDVMSSARRAGIGRIGFVTDPASGR